MRSIEACSVSHGCTIFFFLRCWAPDNGRCRELTTSGNFKSSIISETSFSSSHIFPFLMVILDISMVFHDLFFSRSSWDPSKVFSWWPSLWRKQSIRNCDVRGPKLALWRTQCPEYFFFSSVNLSPESCWYEITFVFEESWDIPGTIWRGVYCSSAANLDRIGSSCNGHSGAKVYVHSEKPFNTRTARRTVMSGWLKIRYIHRTRTKYHCEWANCTIVIPTALGFFTHLVPERAYGTQVEGVGEPHSIRLNN